MERAIKEIASSSELANLYQDIAKNLLDQIYATIEPEVNAHYERWRDDPSLTNIGVNISNISAWVGYYIDQMKIFADNRPAIVKNHMLSQFNLPNFHPLTITNTNTTEGSVEVNENLMIWAKPGVSQAKYS